MRLSRRGILLCRSFTCRQRGRTAGAATPQRLKRRMKMKGMDKEYLCQSVNENIMYKGNILLNRFSQSVAML